MTEHCKPTIMEKIKIILKIKKYMENKRRNCIRLCLFGGDHPKAYALQMPFFWRMNSVEGKIWLQTQKHTVPALKRRGIWVYIKNSKDIFLGQ